MTRSVASTIGVIVAVGLIVLLYVKVLPRKLDGKLNNKYLKWLYNYFHFKRFYIVEILRFLFVLTSVLFFCIGFFTMFSVSEGWTGIQSNFAEGAWLMIGGPIIMRLLFEVQMMAITAVRNLNEINSKMDKLVPKDEKIEDLEKVKQITPVVTNSGAENKAEKVCKKCGKIIGNKAKFCPYCGEKVFEEDDEKAGTDKETLQSKE